MRSGTGTKSDPPTAVARGTKSRIACLTGPSFHDGSGSACAKDGTAGNKLAAARPATNDLRCMLSLSAWARSSQARNTYLMLRSESAHSDAPEASVPIARGNPRAVMGRRDDACCPPFETRPCGPLLRVRRVDGDPSMKSRRLTPFAPALMHVQTHGDVSRRALLTGGLTRCEFGAARPHLCVGVRRASVDFGERTNVTHPFQPCARCAESKSQ